MDLPIGDADRIFLDSAPVIYFIQRHPNYHHLLRPIFDRFDTRELTPVTSPITLAECLIFPMKSGNTGLVSAFLELLGGKRDTVLLTLGDETAKLAAQIRVEHNLTLTDAFQVACAIEGKCDIMLTNDKPLTRITSIQVVLVEDL
jgi:predicted nucleic acid-binding protein